MNGAGVRRLEVDRRAVAAPDRSRRLVEIVEVAPHHVGRDAVEIGRQVACGPAFRGHDPDVVVPPAPPVVLLGVTDERDPLSVGRPGRTRGNARLRREILRLSARGRHHPDVGDDVEVIVVVPLPVRREGEPLAVRGPDRGLVIDRARGQRAHFTRRDVEHVDVRPSLREKSLPVEFVPGPRDVPVTRLRRILLLGLRLLRLLEGHAPGQAPRLGRVARGVDERDARSVGRPGEPAEIAVEIGQPLRLAPIQRQAVDLRSLVFAIRDEAKPSTIGAERRPHVLVLAEGETARLAARRRNEPEVGLIIVLLDVDRPDRVDDPRPVRREGE